MKLFILIVGLFTVSVSGFCQVAANKYPELDTKKYPDFWADYEILSTINELYYGGLNTQEIAVMRSQVENLQKNDSIVKVCENKYKTFMQQYNKVYKKPSALEDVFTDAKNGVSLCYKQILTLNIDKENVVKMANHKIDSLLALYLNNKTLFDASRNPLFGTKSEITKHLNAYIAYQWMLYIQKSDIERLIAIQNAENKIKNAYQTIRVYLLQNTKVLPELYTGSDKEQLRDYVRQKWQQKYPKDEILKIYLPEKEWQKEDGKFFDSQKNETRYFDKSLLLLVVVKKEKEIADMWQVDLKRHEKTKDEIVLAQITKTPDTYLGEVLIEKLY